MKTKIYTLTAICFCILSTSLFAQKSLFAPTEIGMRFGFHNSMVFFEHNYGAGLNGFLPTPATTIGLSFGWKLRNKNFIMLEAELSQQGQKYEDWKVGNDPEFYFQREVDLDYVRLPFYYKRIYKTKKSKLQFYYNLGIYTAILRNANLTYFRANKRVDFVTALTEKNEYADQIYQPDSFNELFNWFDAGILLGWGFQVPVQDNFVFNCDLRSSIGVLDINDLDWRFEHPEFGYNSSNNYMLGVKIGLTYSF